MGILDRVRIWYSIHVVMDVLGNDDEGQSPAGVVSAFALVPPQDDQSVVLIGVRGHDQRHDPGQEIVSLCDPGGIGRAATVRILPVTIGERRVLIVVLVRRDPVVVATVLFARSSANCWSGA